jgi:hypothetical protein
MAPVDTLPVLIDTQPVNLGSPPPTVLAPAAADVCHNADLQSYRTIPMPVEYAVTACGTVLTAPAAMAGARTPAFMLSLDADGSGLPLEVRGDPGMTLTPGQSVVVQGHYFREKSAAERIDLARGGSVQPYSPPPSPSVVVTSSPSSLPTLPPATRGVPPQPRGTPMAPEVAPSPHPAPSLLPH